MKHSVVAIAVIIMLTALTAQAQDTSVPPLINYQGMLGDANGNPLTGIKKLTFNIYDAASGGNLIWGPQVFESVPFINGRFNVILGKEDANGKPIIEAFNEKDRYIGIKVDNNPEIAPRQQILSTPYSIQTLHGGGGVPTGVILSYGGMSAPNGFLECNGSTVSRTTYADLFAAIGTAWGEGDGSTTFHLPDLRGRFLRGIDGGTGRDPDAASRPESNSGGNTGDNVGSVQGQAFFAHNHKTSIDGSPAWTYGKLSGLSYGGIGPIGGGIASSAVNFSIDNAGGSETRPKNAYVKYIIKY